MNKIKKNLIIARVTGTLLGVLLGVLVLVLAAVLKPETLHRIIQVTLIICGIFTIISNIPELVSGAANLNTSLGLVDFISAILGIAMGIALIFFQSTVLVIVIGAYMILFPLLRILMAREKGKQFLREVWRLIMGVLVLVFLPMLLDAAFTVVHILLLVVGWVVIAGAVIAGVISIIRIACADFVGSETRSAHRPSRQRGTVYADTTGDGRIDTIYMDAEGDETTRADRDK